MKYRIIVETLLEELITPVRQALVTVSTLLGISSGQILDPFHEQILVLLQEKKLPQHDVSHIEALALQSFPQHISDTGQVRHGLLAHRLRYKVTVLLRGGGHCSVLYLL